MGEGLKMSWQHGRVARKKTTLKPCEIRTLAEFRAQAKGSTAGMRIKHAKQVDELGQKVGSTKAKLKELGEAGDDAWEQLKVGVASAWGALSAAIQNAAAKLKGWTSSPTPACVVRQNKRLGSQAISRGP